MSINFVDIKSINILEGSVKKIVKTEDNTVLWTSIITISAIPSQSNTLTYTGSSQSPTWNNYDSTQLILSGTIKGTNAGSYTAKFTPKSGYCWSDGSTSAKSVNWTINKKSIEKPYNYSAKWNYRFYYNGITVYSPEIGNYNSAYMTESGTKSAIDVGTYKITYTLISTNYQWSDGTTSACIVSWSILKGALPNITIIAPNGSSTTAGGYVSWKNDMDDMLEAYPNYHVGEITISKSDLTGNVSGGKYKYCYITLYHPDFIASYSSASHDSSDYNWSWISTKNMNYQTGYSKYGICLAIEDMDTPHTIKQGIRLDCSHTDNEYANCQVTWYDYIVKYIA